eukprot:COSAG06_NODE_6217_length_3044_cov_23.832008_3_plen_62_part_00
MPSWMCGDEEADPITKTLARFSVAIGARAVPLGKYTVLPTLAKVCRTQFKKRQDRRSVFCP